MAKAPTPSDRTKARPSAAGPDATDGKLPAPVAQAKMPPAVPDPANGQASSNPGGSGAAAPAHSDAIQPAGTGVNSPGPALGESDQAVLGPQAFAPPRLAIAVTCGLPGGRRRAGRRFGPAPTVIFAGELDELDAEAIQADAALHVRPATDEEIDAAGG